MATSYKISSQNLQKCCLCLTKAKNLVIIPCGHNYCRSCVDCLIRKYERTGSYSCLQCSQTFYTNPDQDGPVDKLEKTHLRTETSADTTAGPSSSSLTRPDQDSPVDGVKMTALHTQTTSDTNARSENMDCDSRQEAAKPCLACLASYCDTHLLHDQLHPRAAHTLMDSNDQLQAMTCSVHGKVLDVYCHNENQRICCMCMLEDHKGHDMVAAGQIVKEEELRKSKQMIAVQEKQLKELGLAKNSLRDIAIATEEESEQLFTKLIHSIKSSQSVMKALIRTQEQAEMDRIEELMENMKEGVTALKRRCAEMEHLLSTQNDIHFMQSVQAFHFTSANVLKMTVNPRFSFGELVKSMYALKQRIDDVWEHEIDQISAAVKKDKIVVPSEPKTRKEFLQCE
ncbi:hypothetical protein AMELA_G00200030 [Ameiurus melas]|uniref:Uncharacterized protein n=1 Tax=Ameiurus melas TaxID=219545 RepID=A0A7J6A6R1_AMEME|nr:hypothetical protein AMELA_G00200030 [Ameiurus melas]